MKVFILRQYAAHERVIDMTPVPGWRRLARRAVAVVVLAVMLPVLWLLGTVALGAILCTAATIPFLAHAKQGWTKRNGSGRTDSRVTFP